MANKCITYYSDLMREPMCDIVFHPSGTAAAAYLKKNAPKYFNGKIRWKGQRLVVTKKQHLQVSIGFRKMVARCLTDEELEIYEKYGDDCWVDYENKKIIAPPKGEKE